MAGRASARRTFSQRIFPPQTESGNLHDIVDRAVTTPQILAFALIGCTVVVFASGRFRYDVVSLVSLGIAMAIGLVPAGKAFSGFTSDVVIIIAAALVVSAAIARSGVVEAAITPVLSRLKTLSAQVPAMAGATGLLSMLTKNVGALAIMMPTAIKLGREPKSSVSSLLMPMSFLSLLGGLVTLVGTSTNIIVSQVREQTFGKPFHMFDFAPVGLSLTVIGFIFVSFAWRILPRNRQAREAMGDQTIEASYSTEAVVCTKLPGAMKTIGDLDLKKDGVKAIGLMHGRKVQRVAARRHLKPGMVLVLEGTDESLAKVFDRLPIERARAEKDIETDKPSEEVRSIEAVVQPDSPLVGSSARRARLQERYGVQLLAISRGSKRIAEQLRDVTIRAGDMLILRAGETALPDMLRDLCILPLAERTVKFGNRRQQFGPIVVLIAAITLIALNIVPVAEGFFGAAVGVVVIGALPVREAYASLEPEVLILIGALTPISEAVQHTGGTAVVASVLAHMLAGMAPILILGVLMVVAMLAAPFLHNAPTVLVLGPIAALIAKQLHLNPDPFLMAVATGAGCDFLTPVGHQCNTLVFGPGGYKFGDYAKLGAPLSIMVILLGTPLIAFFWPLASS